MKVKLEEVLPDQDRSFRLLLTPRLNDQFYWHFHPEYEIVYVEGASGTRHIGSHISRYQGSDLVFMGPNIPHLNFDYGVRTDCEQVIVQMKDDFLGKDFLAAPELGAVHRLFEQARHGLSFHGDTKRVVGERLKKLIALPPFEQLIELLQLFQLLATTEEVTRLNTQPVEYNYNLKEQQRMKRLYAFIEENFKRKIELREVAGLTNLSEAAFCRYFRKLTRMTFTEFLNQYRINQARQLLLLDHNVTEACYESGFESLSYFNKTFKKIAGEIPLRFRKRHLD
ncbi:AraC family transcriptional regulator [Telluribacter sp.]|jgi:AraC-like DNA-binding protein|uniref:helix-turn-helix transcriptional regulator n=1 Tax=Telluribacter sp. TaxID=1978767 RepID=UPI002E1191CA|nr:AraC family transcriptional regulator [Telluribacter sp.]